MPLLQHVCMLQNNAGTAVGESGRCPHAMDGRAGCSKHDVRARLVVWAGNRWLAIDKTSPKSQTYILQCRSLGDIFGHLADTDCSCALFDARSLHSLSSGPDQSRLPTRTYPSLAPSIVRKEHKAASQPRNAGDMMRIITFGDYKTVYLSCCVRVVSCGKGRLKRSSQA
jgi:hypothetical protein